MKTFKITKLQSKFLIKLILKNTGEEKATGSECAYIYKAVNNIIDVTPKKLESLKKEYGFLIGVDLPQPEKDEVEETSEMTQDSVEINS